MRRAVDRVRTLGGSGEILSVARARVARCGASREASSTRMWLANEDTSSTSDAVRARSFGSTTGEGRTGGMTSVMEMLRTLDAGERAAIVRKAVLEDATVRGAAAAALLENRGRGASEVFESMDANEDGTVDEREFMMALSRDGSAREGVETGAGRATLALAQFRAVALNSAVPFIGFGFMDNSVMILAGESIETSLGVGLGLSTMAAAACGNTVSDIVGIGLSNKIEAFADTLGFGMPALNKVQRASTSVRLAKIVGATTGVTIGCFLGAFPLVLGL